MNDTLANLTANASNVSLDALSTSGANETVRQAANNAGGFAVDKLFNMEWTIGVAQWLNATFNTGIFTAPMIGVMVPLVSIALLYFKWGAVVNFIDHIGKFIILAIAGYLVLKAFGVL
jgi:hypothetical protein